MHESGIVKKVRPVVSSAVMQSVSLFLLLSLSFSLFFISFSSWNEGASVVKCHENNFCGREIVLRTKKQKISISPPHLFPGYKRLTVGRNNRVNYTFLPRKSRKTQLVEGHTTGSASLLYSNILGEQLPPKCQMAEISRPVRGQLRAKNRRCNFGVLFPHIFARHLHSMKCFCRMHN